MIKRTFIITLITIFFRYDISCDLSGFFRQAEIRYEIPKNLLKAIAFVESGTTIKGQNKPWPWTANLNGKTHYFNNSMELLRYSESLQDKGVRNFDVGVMQINLKYHYKNFKNLQNCISPYYNIMYAAKFLKECYLSTNNWNKAISRYHSKTSKYGKIYLKKVLEKWEKIKSLDERTFFGHKSSLNSPIISFKQKKYIANNKENAKNKEPLKNKKPTIKNIGTFLSINNLNPNRNFLSIKR